MLTLQIFRELVSEYKCTIAVIVHEGGELTPKKLRDLPLIRYFDRVILLESTKISRRQSISEIIVDKSISEIFPNEPNVLLQVCLEPQVDEPELSTSSDPPSLEPSWKAPPVRRWAVPLFSVVLIALALTVAVILLSQPSIPPTNNSTFELAIARYRLAEKAALQSLNPGVMTQLPVFAHGEALDNIKQHVEVLKTQKLYQDLIVQQHDMRPEVFRDGERSGVLVQEKYAVRTYQPAADGDRLIDEKLFEGKIVYGLIYVDSRWKVERVRPVESTGQLQ